MSINMMSGDTREVSQQIRQQESSKAFTFAGGNEGSHYNPAA